MTTPTSRIDHALVARGLVDTRSKAQTLIRDGSVTVNDRVITKTSHQVTDTDVLVVTSETVDVGRGAIKLRHALDHFGIDVTDAVVVDVGASTGGFTQVVLDRGASHVVAIDVGHGQLHPDLVDHPAITNCEGVNISDVTSQWWQDHRMPEPVSLVVVDVSFISLQRVIPTLVSVFPDADLVLLVKPQFEVGKGKTRGGIVVYDEDRQQAVTDVIAACRAAGAQTVSTTPSPITGKRGNQEYLVYFSRRESAE